MKLEAYIKTFPRLQRSAIRQIIAQATGVSTSAVRHWCNGRRNIPSQHMRTIEKTTGGLVTCYDMLPDERILLTTRGNYHA